jgi:D-aspartate ligase
MRLFAGVGYRGLGYLEMKQHARTGRHLIIEPNIGRPTGRSAIAEAGGVELLYTAYCDMVGLPLPAARQQRYLGVKWIDDRRDVQSALYFLRRGELTIGDWLRSVRGPKSHAVVSRSDPAPFAYDLLQSTRRATRLVAERLRRLTADRWRTGTAGGAVAGPPADGHGSPTGGEELLLAPRGTAQVGTPLSPEGR